MKDLGSDKHSVILVSITYDRALWRRAMTGWWQSVVPPEPFVKRVVFWAVVWALIGLLTLVLTAVGLTPYYVFAGLIGAAFLIGVFGYLQRTRMNRFWDVVGRHWDRAGLTHAEFGKDGISLKDAVSRHEINWDGVDAIKGRRGVTVIRSGISMVAVPDSDLPTDMTGQQFRTILKEWRGV